MKWDADLQSRNFTGLFSVNAEKDALISLYMWKQPPPSQKNKNITELAEGLLGLTKLNAAGGVFRERRKSYKYVSQNYPNSQKTDIFLSHIIETLFFSLFLKKKS